MAIFASKTGSGGVANMFAALQSDEGGGGVPEVDLDLGSAAAADGNSAPLLQQEKKNSKTKKRRRENEYRSVVEDNRKKIEKFAAAGPPAQGKKGKGAGGDQQLVLGGGLSALEKRLLGELARNELGLDVAEGPPPKHTLRISRPADWAKRRAEREDEERRARKARGGKPRPFTAATLPIALRNRFCIDFAVPMPVLESPYFEYFCALYEPVLRSQTNLHLFLEAVNSAGGAGKWKNYTGELVQRIIDDVTGTEAYAAFAADPLSQFDIKDPTPERAATENLYIAENAGKYYVSLDFTSANFNSLRYYNPKLVFDTKNWVEFLSRYTSYQALLNSKRFRAVMMGKINHRAQSKIYHALNHRIYELLLTHNVVDVDQIACKYTDEIVIQTTKEDYQALVAKLKLFLAENVSDIDFVRVEPFRLVRLGPTEDNETYMFVKEALNAQSGGADVGRERGERSPRSSPAAAAPAAVTFKCVLSRKFAQAFKTYFRLAINEMDRTYVDHDGRFHVMPHAELWRSSPST